MDGVLTEGGLRPLGVAVVEVLQSARRSHPVRGSTGEGKANLADNLRKPAPSLRVTAVGEVVKDTWREKGECVQCGEQWGRLEA